MHQLPCWLSGKESTCQAKDTDSSPGSGRKWQPTPVFWPGEFYGLYSPWGCKESDVTEQVSLSLLPIDLPVKF